MADLEKSKKKKEKLNEDGTVKEKFSVRFKRFWDTKTMPKRWAAAKVKLRKDAFIYLLLLFPMALHIIFRYFPMYGIQIVFKDFIFKAGITGSPWADPFFKWFEKIAIDPDFIRAIRNTIVISVGKLVFGFPAPIILALLLNELGAQWYKKTIQSILYLPHFLSWVIISGLMFNLLSENGLLNNVLENVFNLPKVYILGESKYFLTMIFASDIWRNAGWGTIIYLAAIAGVGPELYESARIDGANRFQQILYITLPTIKPTIVILLILNCSSILDAGMDQILNLMSVRTIEVGDIIDTFIYRNSIGNANMPLFEYTTAIGFAKSIVNLIMLLSVNKIAKWLGEDGVL